MIKIVAKRVGEPFKDETIDNELEALQDFVGGYIEHVQLAPGLGVICNEEGRLNDFKFNCWICGHSFLGDIMFVGSDYGEEEFTDCPFSAEELLDELTVFGGSPR